jgi:ATP-dependent Lon protease
VRALEQALATDRTIFLATQHDATVDEPTPEQIYGVGTLGRILQSQKQENGQIKVVVEGRERATTVRVENTDGAFMALVKRAPVVNEEGTRLDALIQKVGQLVEQHLRLAPDSKLTRCKLRCAIRNPSHLADALASQLRISVEDKQGLLESFLRRRAATFDRVAGNRDRETPTRSHDSNSRQATDGEGSKRVLPQRADQSDSQRASAAKTRRPNSKS